ncbi:hypothetical protein [Lysobacter capsici]|uniref:hypothetical protein n=1 Tax=Lysobacter capsici TaxID=435897 RepID=UPI000B1BE752|nr:hypothetical protein [Lysobacter capsici]WND81100.1 hypothetical protein RJ610_01595 [Lysobacter capsici]WND86296.1 hypothetical protein RJ609_01595 [Lysobacter capsici]
MKSLAISVDGDIRAAGFSIGGETRLAQLPDCFVIGEQTPCSILGESVPTQFAVARVESAEGTVNLQLRFEHGVLVSSFITVDDIDGRHETADEFYRSVGKREDRYRQWLKRHIEFELDQFKGGRLGVARDKSENVFVYLHTRNNRWAN